MKEQSGVAISGMAKYVHTVLSPLDMEVISSFQDEMFISHLCINYVRFYTQILVQYSLKHLGHWAKGCCTFVFSLAGLLAVLGILD